LSKQVPPTQAHARPAALQTDRLLERKKSLTENVFGLTKTSSCFVAFLKCRAGKTMYFGSLKNNKCKTKRMIPEPGADICSRVWKKRLMGKSGTKETLQEQMKKSLGSYSQVTSSVAHFLLILVIVHSAFADLTSFLLTRVSASGSQRMLLYLSILAGKMHHPSLL